jgi:hypothetical protein
MAGFSAALLTAEEPHSRGIEFEGKSLSDTLPNFIKFDVIGRRLGMATGKT